MQLLRLWTPSHSPGWLLSLPAEALPLPSSSPGRPSSRQACLILFIHKSWLAEEMREDWEWEQIPGKGQGQVFSSHLKPSLASRRHPPPTPVPQPFSLLAVAIHGFLPLVKL